jgi:hypothetical protein
MKLALRFAGLQILLGCATALAAAAQLSPIDEAAAFRAAGFRFKAGQWHACDDPTPPYAPGVVREVRDLNGDGLPEAVLTEGSAYCYGNAGVSYSLVSKQADGSWRLVTTDTGIATFLPTRGAEGWPDIEVGGPGACFPVMRWNGRAYLLQRHQFQGKPCRAD